MYYGNYHDLDPEAFAQSIAEFLPKGRTGSETYLNTADETADNITGARPKDFPVEVVVDSTAETVTVTRELWGTVDAPEYDNSGADRAATIGDALATAGFDPAVSWQGDFYMIDVTLAYGDTSLDAVSPDTLLALLTLGRVDGHLTVATPTPNSSPAIPATHEQRPEIIPDDTVVDRTFDVANGTITIPDDVTVIPLIDAENFRQYDADAYVQVTLHSNMRGKGYWVEEYTNAGGSPTYERSYGTRTSAIRAAIRRAQKNDIPLSSHIQT